MKEIVKSIFGKEASNDQEILKMYEECLIMAFDKILNEALNEAMCIKRVKPNSNDISSFVSDFLKRKFDYQKDMSVDNFNVWGFGVFRED